jgi:hypothetical protein
MGKHEAWEMDQESCYENGTRVTPTPRCTGTRFGAPCENYRRYYDREEDGLCMGCHERKRGTREAAS